MGRTHLLTTHRSRHAMQLPTHAYPATGSRANATPRWTVTTTPPQFPTNQNELHLLLHKYPIPSTRHHGDYTKALPSRSPDSSPPTLPLRSATTVVTPQPQPQFPRFTSGHLTQLQHFRSDKLLLLHHADHELQNLRIFCPASPHGTHPTISSHSHTSPLTNYTLFSLPPLLLTYTAHTLARGFKQNFNIPYGLAFLKYKKHWRKGRTVITYYKISRRSYALTATPGPAINPHLLATPTYTSP